jgi:hypothetical protein
MSSGSWTRTRRRSLTGYATLACWNTGHSSSSTSSATWWVLAICLDLLRPACTQARACTQPLLASPCIAQEAVLHVTAAELRDIGCKPGHIKKFMKRLMDLQTVVLTKNEAAVREWVYSLRPRRGADGSVPAPMRKLSKSSSSPQRGQHYVSLRNLRRQGSLTDELESIHERHPS